MVELLVVVLIIGILAAISVPQYFKIMEKVKMAEAMAFFDALKVAQEQRLVEKGDYCFSVDVNLCGFTIDLPQLKYFIFQGIVVSGTKWMASLERKSPYPAYYGQYVISYNAGADNYLIFCIGGGCDGDFSGIDPNE